MNPLSRLLASIVAVVALVGAFFFGFVILLFAVGAGLIAWLVIRIRMWWLRRKLEQGGYSSYQGPQQAPGSSGKTAERQNDVIEAEYEVVSRKEDD